MNAVFIWGLKSSTTLCTFVYSTFAKLQTSTSVIHFNNYHENIKIN